MRIIVIGAGEIGKSLVKMLSKEKHEVILIDQSNDLVKDIANQIDILVIKGDATQLSILRDAGIEKSQGVVAVTNDDKTNLMISEIALSSGIKRVISRVNTPGNEELFTKIGVNTLIPTVNLAVTEIKNALMRDDENEQKSRFIAPLGVSDAEIIEVTVNSKSSLIGKETIIPKGVISAIYRNGDILIPLGKQYEIKEGDVLVITAKTKDVGEIIKLVNP
ncbi:MAG: TrkA family potassium uptake protein [Candidatus Woesearchaeota archaeon]